MKQQSFVWPTHPGREEWKLRILKSSISKKIIIFASFSNRRPRNWRGKITQCTSCLAWACVGISLLPWLWTNVINAGEEKVFFFNQKYWRKKKQSATNPGEIYIGGKPSNAYKCTRICMTEFLQRISSTHSADLFYWSWFFVNSLFFAFNLRVFSGGKILCNNEFVAMIDFFQFPVYWNRFEKMP